MQATLNLSLSGPSWKGATPTAFAYEVGDALDVAHASAAQSD